jgi:hypothetical protein
VSKFHLNLLVQFFKVLSNSKKDQLKFEKNFFLNFGPSPVFDPVTAHLPSPQRWPTCQPAQWPSAGPHGLPLFSLADVRAPPLSPSLGQAGRAPPSSVPWREVDPACRLPLPLLYWPPPPPPLLVTSMHRPSSMASPSLHHSPVASLPLGTYKRRLSRTSPHRTPHRPPFLLSCTGACPHCVPSITTALPPSPDRFTAALSPVRAPLSPPRPPLPPPPLVATIGEA